LAARNLLLVVPSLLAAVLLGVLAARDAKWADKFVPRA